MSVPLQNGEDDQRRLGLACFGHAWFFRLVDNVGLVNIPMGTHWLWHTYGAACTVFIFEYFYRLMRDGNATGVDANQPCVQSPVTML